jgi:hypothetical protein
VALAALVAALPPLPLAASDTAPSTTPVAAKPNTLQAAVRAAAVRESAAVATPHASPARRADQSGSSTQSTGFFRSKPGAVALAVMVLGAGYAVYSASHDRITSPAKK